MHVRCNKCGYEWFTRPRMILASSGCPKCSGHVLLSTDEFVEKLKEHNPNIIVLGQYHGSKEKIEVKCKKCGYEWNPVANSLMKKTGCPFCAGNMKLTNEQFLKRMKSIHPSIIVLSDYKNAKSYIDCECKKCGYKWHSQALSLLAGTGCPKCAGTLKKTHIDFCNEINQFFPTLEVLGEYKNAHTKVLMRCNNCGCEWMTKPNNLLNGEGCPDCAEKSRRAKQTKTEEEFIKQISSINPTITVLGNYINSHSRVKCRCQLCGNVWNPLAWDIIRGNGCPACAKTSTSFMEQIILISLRTILGENNVISRDKKTIGMELDIYIPQYKYAIEPGSWFWHSSKINRDIMKRQLCKEKGITLLTVYDSFSNSDVPFEDNCIVYNYDIGAEEKHPTLKSLVENLLSEFGKDCFFSEDVWTQIETDAYIHSHRITTQEFKTRVATRNNKVDIIGEYRGYKQKVRCRCKQCKKEWMVSPVHLLNGQGCADCYGHTKKTLSMLKDELAIINPDITILSRDYINNLTPICVSCKTCGNVWEARPGNLLSGNKCPKCAKKNAAKKNSLTHDQFLERMKEKGNPDVIVVGSYFNAKTSILCRCRKCGNEWTATPNSLLQAHGCKKCADMRLRKNNNMNGNG